MPTQDGDRSPSTAKPGQIGDVIQLVKDYARQETLGPLRGAGRWLAIGIAGAVLIGFGSVLLVLGVLRLFQNEMAPTFEGRWMSLLPYVIAFAFSLLVIGLAASRIVKTSLHPKSDR
jgi:hypothetical protein